MTNNDKKGLSQIIATIVMIVIVLAITSIVFGVVTNLVNEKIEESESCFGNFGKVSIDKKFTCQNPSSKEVQFLVVVGDIEINSILVSISGKLGSKNFQINDTSLTFLRTYNGLYGEKLSIPGKNSGVTYLVNLEEINIGDVSSIQIAPNINGNQCEFSDSLSQIDDCRLLS